MGGMVAEIRGAQGNLKLTADGGGFIFFAAQWA